MSFVWEIQTDDTGTSGTHYRCGLIQEDRSSGELSPKGLFPKTAMIQQRTNMSPPKEVMKIHMSLPTLVSVLLVPSMPFFLKIIKISCQADCLPSWPGASPPPKGPPPGYTEEIHLKTLNKSNIF